MTKQQIIIAKKIIEISNFFGIDPSWALAIAETESSIGENQISPTGAKGIFQLTSIAMKDLLQAMAKKDNDLIDIACGVAFLYLLLNRWGTEGTATEHYCDPTVKEFYVNKISAKKEVYKDWLKNNQIS